MELSVLPLIVALCLPYCGISSPLCLPSRKGLDPSSEHPKRLVKATNPVNKVYFAGWIDDRDEKICYNPIGCLNLTQKWYDLLKRPFNPFPASRYTVGTNFKLYTRKNKIGETLKVDKNEVVKTKYFKSDRETKFVIHGYLEKGSKDWLMEIMQALLQRMDVNVILVDWRRGAQPIYKDAATNTRLVGLEIAYLIKTLIKKSGASAEKFHLIGHSLGAHIAGYAGKNITNLGRITGLDPAGPYFKGMPKFVRLDPSDAKFVDTIRTDDVYGFGTSPEQLGHLEFYPNGGESQPFCVLTEKKRTTLHACYHQRSVQYFLESILSSPYYEEGKGKKCPFTSFGCKSYEDLLRGRCLSCGEDGLNCALMGLDADKYPGLRISGFKGKKFFLKTNTAAPFCGYHYRVILTLAGNEGKIAGNLSLTAVGKGGISTNMILSSGTQAFSSGEHSFLAFSPIQTGRVSSANLDWDWNANSIVNRRSRKMNLTRNLQLSEPVITNSTVNMFVKPNRSLNLSGAVVTNLGYYPPEEFKTSEICSPDDAKDIGTGDRLRIQLKC